VAEHSQGVGNGIRELMQPPRGQSRPLFLVHSQFEWIEYHDFPFSVVTKSGLHLAVYVEHLGTDFFVAVTLGCTEIQMPDSFG